MGQQFDQAKKLSELCRSNGQCKKGVADKDTPVEWYLHSLTKCKSLKDSIESGQYHARPGQEVQIYKPKRRVATAPAYADRVWQRSMCNNGVYDDLTRPFIYDNMACQKGKGTDLTIRRVVHMLQRLHREAPGEPVYGCHMDVRQFFPSTPHEGLRQMDRALMSEPEYIPYLDEIIDNSEDKRPRDEVEADPFGERGTGLGSQINQLHQIAYLDELDHGVKCICRFYIRYNDDFLFLSHDKETVRKAEEAIRKELEGLGLVATVKQRFRAEQGFGFIGKRFILTETGKVIVRLRKGAMADERRVLRALRAQLNTGQTDMEHVRRHYQSVIADYEYAGDAPIRAMDRFYTGQFREKPIYKRKRRYLYGHNQTSAGRDTRPAGRERTVEEVA